VTFVLSGLTAANIPYGVPFPTCKKKSKINTKKRRRHLAVKFETPPPKKNFSPSKLQLFVTV
jgi:hypothetical protein